VPELNKVFSPVEPPLESDATFGSTFSRRRFLLPVFEENATSTLPDFVFRCGRMFCPYLKGTGTDAQGGHADYMLMNADATYLIPDKVSYEQAAPIFCAGYTVYRTSAWPCSGSEGLGT